MQKKNNAPDNPNPTDNKNVFVTPDQNNIQYHRYEEMPYNDYYQENIPENYRYNEDYQPDYRYNYPGIEYEYDRKNIDKDSTTSEEDKKVKKTGRKKIIMEYIEGKNKRSVTFSKRKKGIMKKAYELNVLTGTQILLLVASESGHVYTFATPKLKPIISNHERLIQQCLNAPASPQERNPGPSYNKFGKEDEKKDKFYDGYNNGY
ncbi:transcription factor of the MADS box [Binucleata daphniae]